MYRLILIIILVFYTLLFYSQSVNGKIVSDGGNITVVKVWGTHKERGYAYGYLLADKIKNVHEKFILPSFSPHYSEVRKIIIEEAHIKIDKIYHEEAMSVVEGMKAKGVDVKNIDYIDILLANSFLDVLGLNRGSFLSGCSTLISWGEATEKTFNNGQTVATRHLDWQPYDPLIENQVMVVHIPSESDEQPWLSIGFAGQMSVLSGCNETGVCAFQHDLSDPLQGTTKVGVKYEPIWFTLRNALEKKDYNNDGSNNVIDVKDAMRKNVKGYVDGYIVTAMAPSTEKTDSLIAMVAETTPGTPYLTFRDVSYDDNMEGKNIYAANKAVVRNNRKNYCRRYQDVTKAVGKGTKISSEKGWKIMGSKSKADYTNLHFMQFVPESGILKLSVYKNRVNAYEFEPKTYNLDELFQK